MHQHFCTIATHCVPIPHGSVDSWAASCGLLFGIGHLAGSSTVSSPARSAPICTMLAENALRRRSPGKARRVMCQRRALHVSSCGIVLRKEFVIARVELLMGIVPEVAVVCRKLLDGILEVGDPCRLRPDPLARAAHTRKSVEPTDSRKPKVQTTHGVQ